MGTLSSSQFCSHQDQDGDLAVKPYNRHLQSHREIGDCEQSTLKLRKRILSLKSMPRCTGLGKVGLGAAATQKLDKSAFWGNKKNFGKGF